MSEDELATSDDEAASFSVNVPAGGEGKSGTFTAYVIAGESYISIDVDSMGTLVCKGCGIELYKDHNTTTGTSLDGATATATGVFTFAWKGYNASGPGHFTARGFAGIKKEDMIPTLHFGALASATFGPSNSPGDTKSSTLHLYDPVGGGEASIQSAHTSRCVHMAYSGKTATATFFSHSDTPDSPGAWAHGVGQAWEVKYSPNPPWREISRVKVTLSCDFKAEYFPAKTRELVGTAYERSGTEKEHVAFDPASGTVKVPLAGGTVLKTLKHTVREYWHLAEYSVYSTNYGTTEKEATGNTKRGELIGDTTHLDTVNGYIQPSTTGGAKTVFTCPQTGSTWDVLQTNTPGGSGGGGSGGGGSDGGGSGGGGSDGGEEDAPGYVLLPIGGAADDDDGSGSGDDEAHIHDWSLAEDVTWVIRPKAMSPSGGGDTLSFEWNTVDGRAEFAGFSDIPYERSDNPPEVYAATPRYKAWIENGIGMGIITFPPNTSGDVCAGAPECKILIRAAQKKCDCGATRPIMAAFTEKVHYEQAAFLPEDMFGCFSESAASVPAAVSSVVLGVQSNTEWTIAVSPPEASSWLSVSPSSGVGEGTAVLSFSANTARAARTAEVRLLLSGKEGAASVCTAAQVGAEGTSPLIPANPAITVNPAELIFSSGSGEQTAKITANAEVGAIRARVEGDAWRWLTVTLSDDGTTLTAAADANALGDPARTGTIVIYGANGGTTELTVRQYAYADGDGIRLIPWSVSDGAAYVLLISTAGGVQTLKIYDAGTRAEIASFPCDYPPESLDAIRWKSSNDVIWLTHPERPVMHATRSDAWDADGVHSYAFAFARYPFMVEPMLDWAVGAIPLTLTAQRYRRTSWQSGEIVYNGNSYALSAAHLSYDAEAGSDGVYNVVMSCRFSEPANLDSIPDGSAIQIFGLSFKIFARTRFLDANGYFVSATDVTTYSYKEPRGVLRKLEGVVGSDGGYFDVVVDQIEIRAGSSGGHTAVVQCGGMLAGTADVPVVEREYEVREDFYAETSAIASGFYESLTDDNTEALTNAAAWRRTFCIGKKLRLYGASVEEWRAGQHFALTAKAYSAASGSWGVDAAGEISESLLAFGSVTLKTEGGVWSGRLVLEQSLDDGETWEFLDAIVSENGSSNPKITVDVDEIGALVRVRCDRRETATTRQALVPSDGGTVKYKEVENDTGCKWTLTCEGYSDVYVKVKSLHGVGSDDAYCVVECISGCPYPISTTTWAEGAWCPRYGYPRTVTLHEERLCFAGNVKRPATLWCSAINHYDDFRRGTLDTSALSVKPTAHSYGRAAWLASGRQLLLGTTLEEFAVGSRDAVAAMSGSNIVAKSSASFGSADADCVTTREGIFTVLPGRRKIGALKYDMVEEYTGTEVSQRAETLLSSGVRELAHVRAPQDVLFALCEDGTVAALTYDFSQNVAGWSRLTVLEGVGAMCAVRRGERDVLVLAVVSRGEVLLGEIDFGGDVWTDDGLAYESVCEPMPMPVYSDEPHGATGKVAQADIYLTAGTVFDYSFDGGARAHRMVAKGRDGKAKTLFGRIELGQSGDWTEEATVVFSTSYAGPFVIAAVGAEIKVGG